MSKAIEISEEEKRPLSVREGHRLAELEKVIEQDFQAFYRVGMALAEIKAGKLYRESHPGDFEGYCKQVFDLAKSHANRLMQAAEVYDNLLLTVGGDREEVETSPIGEVLPKNEAQIRPLTRLRPEQQRQVWQEVVSALPDGQKPTAGLVGKVVKEYLGEEVQKGLRKAKKQAAGLGPDAFQAAAQAFMGQIEAARQDGYRQVERQTIVDWLDQARAILAADGDLLGDSVIGASRDANKLERAGFTLFRMDTTSMNIKERAGGGWPKHSGPFETKKAMQEAFEALLADPMHIAG